MVAEFISFGFQVGEIRIIRGHFNRDALDDLEAVPFDADDLARVIGQKLDLIAADVTQDLSPHAVVTKVGLKTEVTIRFDRVHALILKRVRADFVRKTNAPALMLSHVNEDAVATLGDLFERGLKLRTAIATKGTERVTGQAFRMQANERGNSV